MEVAAAAALGLRRRRGEGRRESGGDPRALGRRGRPRWGAGSAPRPGGAFLAAGGQVPAGREGRRPLGTKRALVRAWRGLPAAVPSPRRGFVLSRPAPEAVG